MGDASADAIPGLTADDRAFLAEIRLFLERHWPGMRRAAASGGGHGGAHAAVPAEARAWFEALVGRGWSVPEWPAEHGGAGWSPLRCYLWNRELALAEAPVMDPIGVNWAGPALIGWGDRAQQTAYLAGIREARERWCLGIAEPQAGSDLTGLQTHARPLASDGFDGYAVDGLKSWVTGAADARWMLTLVRTGPETVPAENALSALIVDLHAPGVRIEPVRMLDGTRDVCRVRLDGVRVPSSRRIGAEGDGWRIHQALAAGAGRRPEPAAALRLLAGRLAGVAAELPGDEGPLAADPGFARKLAELGVDLAGLEALELRVVRGEAARARSGREAPGGETSSRERSPDRDSGPKDRDLEIAPIGNDRDLEIAPTASNRDLEIAPTGGGRGPERVSAETLAAVLRLRRTGISQRIGELFVEAFGYYSLPYPDPLTIDNEGPIGHDYALAALQGMLAGRSLSIDGGPGEALRDRIAHQLFGY
jgi:alkylation response protein AidB-like acyl-CoA dehydrogenase